MHSGEKQNILAEHAELVEVLANLLQLCVDNGRSTPGPKRTNDVPVEFKLAATLAKSKGPQP